MDLWTCEHQSHAYVYIYVYVSYVITLNFLICKAISPSANIAAPGVSLFSLFFRRPIKVFFGNVLGGDRKKAKKKTPSGAAMFALTCTA